MISRKSSRILHPFPMMPATINTFTFPWERKSAFRTVERTMSGDPLPGSFAPTGRSQHQSPAWMQAVGNQGRSPNAHHKCCCRKYQIATHGNPQSSKTNRSDRPTDKKHINHRVEVIHREPIIKPSDREGSLATQGYFLRLFPFFTTTTSSYHRSVKPSNFFVS